MSRYAGPFWSKFISMILSFRGISHSANVNPWQVCTFFYPNLFGFGESKSLNISHHFQLCFKASIQITGQSRKLFVNFSETKASEENFFIENCSHQYAHTDHNLRGCVASEIMGLFKISKLKIKLIVSVQRPLKQLYISSSDFTPIMRIAKITCMTILFSINLIMSMNRKHKSALLLASG
jgi:hypothetical protein